VVGRRGYRRGKTSTQSLYSNMVFFGFSTGRAGERAGATILHGVFWILNRQAGGRAGRGDDQ
jgi:hypothetical protein